MMRFWLALAVVAGCQTHDNSADTDRSGGALTEAQTAVTEKRNSVRAQESDLERDKRALLQQQQALVDQEKALATERGQLGSARDSLVRARATYSVDVVARLAKLDATLATLARNTDAASRDAVVGLRARREQLVAKLATMTSTPDQNWAVYAKDVDTTFDAIEHDLHEASD